VIDLTPKFSRPRPNVIESDAGYSVERVGRDGLRYQEGGRSILISSEMLGHDNLFKGFVIYTDSIKNWDLPDGSRITKQERDRIVNNIRLALASQDESLEIDY